MQDLVLTPMQHMFWFGNMFYDYCKNDKAVLTWIPVGTMRGTLVVFRSENQKPVPRKIQQLVLSNQTRLVSISLKKEQEHKRYTVFFKELPPYLKLKTIDGNEADFLTFIAFKSYLFTKFDKMFYSGLISDISGKEYPVANIRCHPDVVSFLKGLDIVDTVIEDNLLQDECGKTKKGFLDTYCETGSEGFHWIVTEFAHRTHPYEDQVHLKDGDHLTIFGDSDAIVWQGKIKYDWEVGYTPYPRNPKNGQQLALGCWVNGIQKGFAPDDWAKLFFRGKNPRLSDAPYRAIVTQGEIEE